MVKGGLALVKKDQTSYYRVEYMPGKQRGSVPATLGTPCVAAVVGDGCYSGPAEDALQLA